MLLKLHRFTYEFNYVRRNIKYTIILKVTLNLFTFTPIIKLTNLIELVGKIHS